MRLRARLFFAIVGVFIFTSGCDKIQKLGLSPAPASPKGSAGQEMPVVKGTIVAKVNNLPITLEELNLEVEAYNSMVPEERAEARITTRDQKIAYLKEQMVRALLMYQSALDKRLDASEDVQRYLERAKRELLVMELYRQEVGTMDATSAEIEEYYNVYKDRLKQPEERKLREIIVPSEAEAKDILIQLLQGADFSTLARERSRAASAREGGSLGLLKPGDKTSEFDKIAFSETLEAGQVSSIFRVPEGFSIIKIEEIKGGKTLTITEVWDDLKRMLTLLKQQKRVEELVEQLKNNARIEVYESEIQ